MGRASEGLVLRVGQHRVPGRSSGRVIRLWRGLQQLPGRLVGDQEGVVLREPPHRMPEPAIHHDAIHIGAAHHDHSLGALVRLQGRLGSLDVELVAREEGLVLPEGGQGLHAGDDHDAVLAWSAHYDHTVPSGSDAATDDHHAIQYDAEDNDDALPGGAHTSTDHDDAIPGDAQARDLRLRSRLGELAPRMVRREEGLVLSALWKGMQSTPGRDHYDPIPQSPNAPIGLRLRCRFLQLDHLLVRGEEGLVL
mmetsp:Transcript_72913/g.142991  ORF Transcript_72913/g.142991 Transcript_72913/m.142991 type:complete len:251 (-) Transcript_72913:46-798(-)